MAQHANINNGVQMQQQGNARLFTYRKAKYSASIIFFCMIPFGVISLMLAIPLDSLRVLVFGTFILPFILFFILNAVRKEGTFSITPQSIEVGGTSYPLSGISEISIKVPQQEEQSVQIGRQTNGMFYVVSGNAAFVTAYASAIGVAKVGSLGADAAKEVTLASARRVIKQFVEKNVQINFLYQGKKIKLANAMTGPTAAAVYAQVLKALSPLKTVAA